jgi:hypothetical protein
VTNDADAATAKQRRATVGGGIKSLERDFDVLGIEVGVLAEHANHQRRYGLVKLEHDVTHEAIADYHVKCPAVAGTGRQITTLEITVEIETCFLKQRVCFLDNCVSLLGFLSDRQQANRRVLAPENALRVNRAKPRELQELLARTIDIGA